MFTVLAVIVLPTIAAGLARLGLINNYAASILSYLLTGNVLCAITTYLAVSLGSAVAELNGFSTDPEILAISDMSQVQGAAPYDNPREVYYLTITRRFISIILSATIFGALFPKVPLMALPWWIYVLFFGGIIISRNRTLCPHRDDLPIPTYLVLAGILWVIAMYFNYIQIPLNVVFISIAAISSMLNNYIGIEHYHEQPQDGHPLTYLNWVEILLTTAIVWVVPGLTSSAAARATSSNPNWLVGIGGVDAILEGWTLGAWFFHGSLSGKTMLGAALQSWSSTLDLPVLPIILTALLVAYGCNLVLVRLLDPLEFPYSTLQILPLLIVFPIIINVICTIADPIGIIVVLLASVLAAVFGSRPGMRSLIILFVTAG
jgi:hypothetical protein